MLQSDLKENCKTFSFCKKKKPHKHGSGKKTIKQRQIARIPKLIKRQSKKRDKPEKDGGKRRLNGANAFIHILPIKNSSVFLFLNNAV